MWQLEAPECTSMYKRLPLRIRRSGSELQGMSVTDVRQIESPAATPHARSCRAQVAYLDGRITSFATALEAQGLGPPQPVSATTQVNQ
jgi:hypothetical protein